VGPDDDTNITVNTGIVLGGNWVTHRDADFSEWNYAGGALMNTSGFGFREFWWN
jgi:hypothetical protein